MMLKPLHSAESDGLCQLCASPWSLLASLAPLSIEIAVAVIGAISVIEHLGALAGLVSVMATPHAPGFFAGICLVALATSLMLVWRSGPRWRVSRIALACFSILISSAVAKHLFGVLAATDEALDRLATQVGIGTAACLALLGASMLLIEYARLQRVARFVALLALIASMCLLAVVREPSGVLSHLAMTGVLLLAIGVFFLQPPSGRLP